MRRIVDLGSKMGLILNAAKCELVAHSGLIVDDRSPVFSLATLPCLMGLHMFLGKVLNDFWPKRCSDLSRTVDRLCLIGTQDAILLRASVIALEFNICYAARSPSVDACGRRTFDDLLKSALSRFTNNTLSDSQWLQASHQVWWSWY